MAIRPYEIDWQIASIFLTTKGKVSMKYLLLLLALIVVPAWAADAAPATTSAAPSASAAPAAAAQPATAKPAKKHKKKKTEKKAEENTSSPALMACSKQICGGVQGCYQSKCGAICNTGC